MNLTHFGYGGTLETPRGRIYVVDRRAVIAGMQAPRGLNFMTFFDESCRYLGKTRYISARPLWCEGGKLFPSGGLDSGEGSGNVIGMNGGFENRRIITESVYGSSGRIENQIRPSGPG